MEKRLNRISYLKVCPQCIKVVFPLIALTAAALKNFISNFKKSSVYCKSAALISPLVIF